MLARKTDKISGCSAGQSGVSSRSTERCVCILHSFVSRCKLVFSGARVVKNLPVLEAAFLTRQEIAKQGMEKVPGIAGYRRRKTGFLTAGKLTKFPTGSENFVHVTLSQRLKLYGLLANIECVM